MEYQKITNLLDDSPNKTFKFRTRNWVEINDESRGKYNDEKEIRFKKAMLKSSLCDYSNEYILVKGKITTTGAEADTASRQADNGAGKKVQHLKIVLHSPLVKVISTILK